MSDGRASTIEVIVKLTPEAAAPESPQQRRLQARAAELGIPLAPLHPSTSDPDLAAWAVAEVDPTAADVVIEELRRCDGVEGAYAKAQGAPPERRPRHVQQPH